MQEQSLIVLAGALIGLLPTLLTLFFSWVEKRTLVEKQNRVLGLAKQRVEFLTALAKAQEPLCAPERYQELQRSVSHDLDQVLENVRQVMLDQIDLQSNKKPQRNFFQRWLLLYQPRSVMGWVYHTIFYMLAGIFFLWWLDVPIFPQKYFGTGGVFAGLVIITLPIAFFALLFRLLATRQDRKMEEKTVTPNAKKEIAKTA